MAQDRISSISDFLNYREVRRSNRNPTKPTRTLTQIRERGLTDKVVFVSSNPILLKATEQNIKGNILTVLLNPITFGAIDRVVIHHNPQIIILDNQTPRVDNLLETLLIKGYEVYEY